MEHIRTYSEEPREALAQARRFKTHARKDWRQVNISIVSFSTSTSPFYCILSKLADKMDEVLRCKFSQHPNLARELIDTGTAELVEVCALPSSQNPQSHATFRIHMSILIGE
jgi:predicted NAD-dependent protein-ADP-ribosyltransferase YbiA (DUF1768 family)